MFRFVINRSNDCDLSDNPWITAKYEELRRNKNILYVFCGISFINRDKL